jgi:hypothetical protein
MKLEPKPLVLSISLFINNDLNNPECVNARIPLRSWRHESDDGETTQTQHPEVTFNFDEAATVYGYVLIDESDRVWHGEIFNGAPFVIPDAGGSVAIAPKLYMPSQLARYMPTLSIRLGISHRGVG